MHKLVPFGSKLVPIGSYGFFSSQIGYKLKNGFLTVHLHIHCSKIGLKISKSRFKVVQYTVHHQTFTQKGLRMTASGSKLGIV